MRTTATWNCVHVRRQKCSIQGDFAKHFVASLIVDNEYAEGLVYQKWSVLFTLTAV